MKLSEVEWSGMKPVKKANISDIADHMLISVSEEDPPELPVVFCFHVPNACLAAGFSLWVCST